MRKKFLLAESGDQMNMVSCWTDELYLSLLSTGKFSLLVRKNAFADGSGWLPAVRNISSPSEFISAYFSLDGINTEEWNFIGEIIPKVTACHAKLGTILELEYFNQYEEEDDPKVTLIYDLLFFSELEIFNGERTLTEQIIFLKTKILNIINSERNLPRGRQYFDQAEVKFPSKMKKFDSVLKQILDDEIIFGHLKNAVWKKSAGYLNAGWVNAGKGAKIKRFVEKYYHEHGYLPWGDFTFADISVTFKK